jgi:signal transduction histidine kinase
MSATQPAAVAPASPVVHRTEPLARGPLWRPGVPARAGRELGYLMLVLLLSPFTFAYAVVAVVFPPAVAVTVVGLLPAGWVVVGGRMCSALHRGLAAGLLRVVVDPPPPRRRARGFWRRTGALLGDVPGWRGIAFGALSFPLAIAAVSVCLPLLATGLGGLTHWYWYRWLPAQEGADGRLHRGASFGDGYFVDTPPRQVLLMVVGVLCLLLAHRLVLGFGHLFRLLARNLLGPTAAGLRVAHLEQTRGAAVTDADARLRRIERDLHDGTQARLVAVAMQIGDARDRLDGTGAADPGALDLLDDAHGALKQTLVELREIARGIHPPALDDGLAVALETLASRAPVPVTVDVDLPVRPAPEVETIAYFAVAELLTNVARHAGASGAYVRADVVDGALVLRVRDDGRGGARLALPGASGGTGLAGLAERVATVDGRLDLDSPVGGPTVVTVHLPLSAVR